MEKEVLVTNNPLVKEQYQGEARIDYMDTDLLGVLVYVRNLIHTGHKLLTHPLSGSVKPNETFYKSVLITGFPENPDIQSINITNYPFNLPSARINWDIININPFLPSQDISMPVNLPAGIINPVITVGDEPADSSIPVVTERGALEALDPQGACETCKNRKYVDQSDDASVSFQTPTNISPGMAGAAVAAHEQEHVRNEQANAQREGREIVNQSVSLTYSTCPECGKHYVSGGTTRTTSVSKPESDDSEDMPVSGASPGGEASDDE